MKTRLIAFVAASLLLASQPVCATDPPGADTARLLGIGTTYVNADYTFYVHVFALERVAEHERLTPPPIQAGYDYQIYVFGGAGFAQCSGSVSGGHAVDVNAGATSGTLTIDATSSDIWCLPGSQRYVISLSCLANGDSEYDSYNSTRSRQPSGEQRALHIGRINSADCELTIGSQTFSSDGSLEVTKVTYMDR